MIIKNDEEYFRNVKCTDASETEARDIIIQLEAELANSIKLGTNGIGLAAPQIGIEKNVAILRINKTNLNLVNCKIKSFYDLRVFQGEGCLSFPGRSETTQRYQEVHIVNNMVSQDFVATGMVAIACQHEMDHWNNKIFFDYKQKPVINNVKIRPNDPCICGKSIKYKKCCGRNV